MIFCNYTKILVFLFPEIDVGIEFKHTPIYKQQPCSQSLPAASSRTNNSKRHACTKCPKTYKSKYYLNCHLRIEHGNALDLHCDHCPYFNKVRGNLISHIKLKHGLSASFPDRMTKLFKCDQCDKIYKTPDSLLKHQKQACRKQSCYFCKYCNYSTKQKALFTSHVKIHENNDSANYICIKCGQKFKHQYTLTRHSDYMCKKLP